MTKRAKCRLLTLPNGTFELSGFAIPGVSPRFNVSSRARRLLTRLAGTSASTMKFDCGVMARPLGSARASRRSLGSDQVAKSSVGREPIDQVPCPTTPGMRDRNHITTSWCVNPDFVPQPAGQIAARKFAPVARRAAGCEVRARRSALGAVLLRHSGPGVQNAPLHNAPPPHARRLRPRRATMSSVTSFNYERIAADGVHGRVRFLAWDGGGSGIRTHDTVSRIHAFQACALSHSAIPPWGLRRAQYSDARPGDNPTQF